MRIEQFIPQMHPLDQADYGAIVADVQRSPLFAFEADG
jgi:hypothetical protein